MPCPDRWLEKVPLALVQPVQLGVGDEALEPLPLVFNLLSETHTQVLQLLHLHLRLPLLSFSPILLSRLPLLNPMLFFRLLSLP